MRFITIDGEYGSGSNRLGKLLASELGILCHDEDIVDEVAKRSGLDRNYVKDILRRGPPRTLFIGRDPRRSCACVPQYPHDPFNIFAAQSQVVREFSSEDSCVIVGHNADIPLAQLHPLTLFAYASIEARIARYRADDAQKGEYSDSDIKKELKRLDTARSSYYEVASGSSWGKRKNYHLCVDTSSIQLDKFASILSQYAATWFGQSF